MQNFRKEFTSTTIIKPFEKTIVIKEKWVFDDIGITFEKIHDEESMKEIGNGRIKKCFYPYGNLKKIKFSRGWIEILFFDNHSIENLATRESISMSPEENNIEDMKFAVKFAKQQQKKQGVDFSKTRVLEVVTGNKFDNGIFIKQCEICGHVFQYTYDDMQKSVETSFEIDRLQKNSEIPWIGLMGLSSQISGMRAENMRNSQVDYSSCPKCHSKNLKRISKEELAIIQAKQSEIIVKQEVPQSNADEIKKFKELLDLGAITEEEFNAKKKELLGL